jgi:hypothetical protein
VGGQITQFGDGAFDCLLDAGHFVAPSGLIGRERAEERRMLCRPFGRHSSFDRVLWEIHLNLETESGAGEAKYDIAVCIRVVAKAVAPSARRWGEAAG